MDPRPDECRQPADQDLVARCLRGDADAFQELAGRYYRPVGGFVFKRVRRPDVVEEFDSAAFRGALRQTAHKWGPRIAQLEFTQMAQYAADCAPAKTILVEHAAMVSPESSPLSVLEAMTHAALV